MGLVFGFFHTKPLKSSVYFVASVHCNSDGLHCKRSIAICTGGYRFGQSRTRPFFESKIKPDCQTRRHLLLSHWGHLRSIFVSYRLFSPKLHPVPCSLFRQQEAADILSQTPVPCITGEASFGWLLFISQIPKEFRVFTAPFKHL